MNSAITGGSRRTLEFAERHGKPCLHLHPGLREDPVKAIVVTSIQDNATAPPGYGNHRVPDCWRVYYQLAGGNPTLLGGNSPYLLVAKKTRRILQQNTESGE